jgi:hypothetical protein
MAELKKSDLEVMLDDMGIATKNLVQVLISIVPGDIVRLQAIYNLGKDQFDRLQQEMNEYIAVPKKQKKNG